LVKQKNMGARGGNPRSKSAGKGAAKALQGGTIPGVYYYEFETTLNPEKSTDQEKTNKKKKRFKNPKKGKSGPRCFHSGGREKEKLATEKKNIIKGGRNTRGGEREECGREGAKRGEPKKVPKSRRAKPPGTTGGGLNQKGGIPGGVGKVGQTAAKKSEIGNFGGGSRGNGFF